MNNTDSIKALQKMIKAFCEERNWDQFHNPKDLAIGISTEANELLDLFRFKSDAQLKEIIEDDVRRLRVEEELADVLFFVLRFAQMNDIDLEQALNHKMLRNGEKYPVEKVKGKNLKYDEY